MKLQLSLLAVAAVFTCIPLEVLGDAACHRFYETGDASVTGNMAGSTPAKLDCSDFEGDATLHAIAYGCNSVNQGVHACLLPETTTTLSFNRICQARPDGNTIFTCYTMSNTSVFTDFEQDIRDLNVNVCQPGDNFTNPMYMYQNTTASYSNGVGGQRTGGNITSSFDPFYAKTYPMYAVLDFNDGTALTYVPKPTPAPTDPCAGPATDSGTITVDSGSGTVDVDGNQTANNPSTGPRVAPSFLPLASLLSVAVAIWCV